MITQPCQRQWKDLALVNMLGVVILNPPADGANGVGLPIECMRPLSTFALSKLDMARTVQCRKEASLRDIPRFRPPVCAFSSSTSLQSFRRFINRVKYLHAKTFAYLSLKKKKLDLSNTNAKFWKSRLPASDIRERNLDSQKFMPRKSCQPLRWSWTGAAEEQVDTTQLPSATNAQTPGDSIHNGFVFLENANT